MERFIIIWKLEMKLRDKVNFKTNSDVECILKLYELYFDCVKKLRGMFSLRNL